MNLRWAEAIAVYVAPAVLLLAVIAWGLWHTPNELWGMYANQDGMWAVWNARGILEWGRFLDLSPFNPLSGMGSLFLPNLPWLNPAAAVLALPLPRDLTYLISYLLYGIEIFVSIVVLFRVLGLSPLRSSLGAQFHLLMLFPPLVSSFYSLSWYAMAPVNAHLVAMANLALAGFIALAQSESLRRNAALAAGSVAFLAAGFFSAPITFLTYGPVYATITAAILLWQRRNRKAVVWRISVLFGLALAAWLGGVIDYYRATVALSARSHVFPPAFAAGADLLSPTYWVNVWRQFSVCEPPEQPLCKQHSVFYVHAVAIGGALIQMWRNPPLLRLLAALFLTFIAAVEIYSFVGYVSLLGKFHTIRTPFIMWSAYTFFALFVVILVFAPVDIYRDVRVKIARRLANDGLEPVPSSAPGGPRLFAAPISCVLAAGVMALMVPAWACYLWKTDIAPNQPPPPAHKKPVGFLGKSSVRTPVVGAVTNYLIEHASLRPGLAFRGYVVTYLGDRHGHVRTGVDFKGPGMAPDIYVDARRYLDHHFGNRFQEMDLWEFGIPTLEEYGQWITKSAYGFVNAVFGRPADRFNPNFLLVYTLDFDALAALGVRFVITDVDVHDSRATLRVRQDSASAGPIHLYELASPNVATYSPTRTIKVETFQDAVTAFKANAAGLTDSVILFEDLQGPFQKAGKIELRMTRDGFRVTAESSGASLVVLPVQFSRCFHIEPLATSAGLTEAALFRANGIQTLLKFVNKVDVSVRFDFGLFGNAGCRSEEAKELARLGVR